MASSAVLHGLGDPRGPGVDLVDQQVRQNPNSTVDAHALPNVAEALRRAREHERV